MEVEVCIIKKLFSHVTVELEGEDPSLEDLSSAVKNEIQRINDEDDWYEVDYYGKERYEAYETYGGTDIPLDD
jgi:hypothetical protein